MSTSTPDYTRPTLQKFTDDELVAEVRRRTIGLIHYLYGLQLIRVYEAIKEIAPDVVRCQP